MKKTKIVSAITALLLASPTYSETETSVTDTASKNSAWSTNSNQWTGSLIVEGLYIDRSNNEDLEILGMPSGGHNHGVEEGLQAGHSEIVVTGDITDKLNARITAAIIEGDEGESIDTELEEAFIETQGLGNGLSAKAGRFFSDIGYLSSKHNHEWDFANQPLVYEGMFGEHTIGDGVQLNYLAPTDTYLKLGTELFFDEGFPSGETSSKISAATIYAKTGGDIGTDHSWLAGIGHWRSGDITDRSSEAHDHGGGAAIETPRFSGDSKINTVNVMYKWAPNGNAKERNFKLQAEYFQRDENGTIDMVEPDGSFEESSSYQGDQSGWFIQGSYQFRPHWRIGLRHDQLKIRNSGSDEDVLEEAELLSNGHTPKRNSIMIDYSPREYSRLRLQFNRDERSTTADDQVILQYIYSFGSHGAHAF